ncbi:hypothetical protein KR018_012638 [Drosophila ironensis]|nr:hypothetical protein KR018_012638 [Drosophila ironensis]
MVIGSFPVGKVVIFGVKRVCGPISKALLYFGKTVPAFRKIVIQPPGQLYHNVEIRSKMRMLHLKQPRSIPPLTDAQATQLGANILSEVIVVFIGLGLIYYEISNQMKKDAKKHHQHTENRAALYGRIDEIDADVERQEKEINWLKRNLVADSYDDYDCDP